MIDDGSIGKTHGFTSLASVFDLSDKLYSEEAYAKRQVTVHFFDERASITTCSEARESKDNQSSVCVALTMEVQGDDKQTHVRTRANTHVRTRAKKESVEKRKTKPVHFLELV